MSKSSTIMSDGEPLANPHPGEILLEEFLKPMGLSQKALARAIQVPPRRINEIVHGKRAVTEDTDLRLARYFGLSEGFFLGLQSDYDLMRRRVIKADIREGGRHAGGGKFEILRQKDGQFYFVLKAANGEIIARSEAYRGKSGCMNGIDSIKKNAIDAPVIDLSAA